MAVPRNGERVVSETDGVKVRKELVGDQFPAPTMTIEIDSRREDAASIELVDTVPESVDVENLGFHPEYGEADWTVGEDSLTLNCDIEPEGEYRTLYAISNEDAPLDAFLVEPERISVSHREPDADVPTAADGRGGTDDAAAPDDGATPDDVSAAMPDEEAAGGSDENDNDSTAVDDATSAESDAAEESSADDASEELVIPEVNADDATTGTDGDLSLDLDADPLEAAESTVADALLQELRTGAVSERQRDALREELDLATGSVDARLSKLQSDVADLEAYSAALEEFLDEHGTGAQLIEDFEDRLGDLEGDIGALEAAVQDKDEHIADIEGRTETIEAELDTFDAELDDLEGTVESLAEDLETVEASLPENSDIGAEIESLEDELATIRTWQERLEGALAGDATQEADAD